MNNRTLNGFQYNDSFETVLNGLQTAFGSQYFNTNNSEDLSVLLAREESIDTFLNLQTTHNIEDTSVLVTTNVTVSNLEKKMTCNSADGYAFITKPLSVNNLIKVTVLNSQRIDAEIQFGVTSADPKNINIEQLPFNSFDLLEMPEYYQPFKCKFNSLNVGDELTFNFNENGNFYCKKNSIEKLVGQIITSDVIFFFIKFGSLKSVSYEILRKENNSRQNSVSLNNLYPNLYTDSALNSGDSNIDRVIEEPTNANTTDDKMCLICVTNPSEMCCYPCGHVVLCESCSTKYNESERLKPYVKCPICRAKVSGMCKIHF